MKCSKCSKDWPDQAKFCGICGTNLVGASPGEGAAAAQEKDPELTVPAKDSTPPRREARKVFVVAEKRRPETSPEPSGPHDFTAQMTALADQAGFKVKSVANGVIGTVFPLKDGRTQIVVFKYAGELAGKPIVRINSPVADLKKNPINGEAAIGLLNAAGKVKIGGFSIDGDHLVVHQGMILSELTPEELRDVALALAVFADDAEKNLTGGDAF